MIYRLSERPLMTLIKTRLLSARFAALILATAAVDTANADDVEEDWNCTPAKQLVSAAKAFYSKKPELVDVIDPVLNVSLKGINGHPDPIHLLYRFEDFEYSMPIEEGLLQGLDAAKDWSNNGEFCSVYADGPLKETEDSTVTLSVSFGFPFRRKDGLFSVDEIKEGTKDGSKIIKSLAPKGLGFAAPGLKTFIVAMPFSKTDSIEPKVLPVLTFMRDGTPKAVMKSQRMKQNASKLCKNNITE